jgi:predicted DNA-binding transcriptional regulator AlpA
LLWTLRTETLANYWCRGTIQERPPQYSCRSAETTVKRIIRPKEAMARLGIGHSKFYDDIKKGVLPKPVRLGPRSVGIIEEELDAVVERLRAERDGREAGKVPL